MSQLQQNLVACPECDLLQRIPAIPPGGRARCPRCNHTIASSKPDSLERTLALTVAAAIVLVVANVAPLMGITAVGRNASTTIVGGALEMWMQGKGLGNCSRQLLKEVATVRSLDVVLPVRQSQSQETRQLRLRVVARPDRPVAELLVRLGLELPNAPKLLQNVVEKNGL